MASTQEPIPLWPRDGEALLRPGPPARQRRLEVWLSVAAVLFVLLLVGVVELSLRLLHVRGKEGALGPLHVYSEVYGWEPRRGFRMVEENRATTINASGYRGDEIPPPGSGRARVVVLGDSIAFGPDVDDAQTFSHVLSARTQADVANLAVPGYDPGQELIKLEREGLGLRPDVVILAICMANDFADAALPVFLYDGRHPKLFFRVEGQELVEHREHLRLSLRDRTALVLRENSRLYGLISDRLQESRSVPQVEHWMKRRKKALRDRAGVIDLTARLVGRMADDCRRAGVGFVVLAFPDKDMFKGDTSWLQDLRAAPPLAGVAIVDMAARFKERGMLFRDIAQDGIGHLSPKGHEAAAIIIEDILVDRGVVPPARRAGVPSPVPVPE